MTGDDSSSAGDGSPAEDISLRNVRKQYGPVTALDGVDLDIHPGEFHGLVGPNGSGKTTLFRILAGLVTPSGGAVDRADASVGFSFQAPRFYPDLTVRENVQVFRSLQDDPEPQEWVERVIEGLRLEPAAHRVAGDLSGGFQTKLDLALGLVKRPQYLLLDEPFSDVDDHSRRVIREFLAEFQADGRTVVVSTHNLDDFAPVLDRLTVLYDGTVRYDGVAGDDVRDRYRAALDD